MIITQKRRSRRKQLLDLGKIAWSIGRTFLLIILSFVIIYPLLRTISRAFMPFQEYSDPSIVWIPKTLTMINIEAAMETMNFWPTFGRTVFLCRGCTIMQELSSEVVGYGFARFNFRFRSLCFAMVILTIVVPTNLIYLPMMMQYRFFDFFGVSHILGLVTGKPYTDYTINLLNNYATFFMPSILGVGVRSGLFIYIFRQFFRNVPKELEEAAKIDGCSPWKTFTRIMLPNAGNSAITVFLFSVVWHWNETRIATAFVPYKKPMAVVLQELSGSIDAAVSAGYYEAIGRNWASAQAMRYGGMILFLIPVLLLYVVAQRFFVEGVETTGIKG